MSKFSKADQEEAIEEAVKEETEQTSKGQKEEAGKQESRSRTARVNRLSHCFLIFSFLFFG